MTLATPAGALPGACHVVMKVPAIGVAVCAISAAGFAGAVPVSFHGGNPPAMSACVDDAKQYVLVDLDRMPFVERGDCLDKVITVSLPQVQDRCSGLPAGDRPQFCGQVGGK